MSADYPFNYDEDDYLEDEDFYYNYEEDDYDELDGFEIDEDD
ncbi:hypothetical protein [Helicobacter felis]|nr:hypothetical protein [Helicobacter felis]